MAKITLTTTINVPDVTTQQALVLFTDWHNYEGSKHEGETRVQFAKRINDTRIAQEIFLGKEKAAKDAVVVVNDITAE
jgi:hypothetical protein